MSRRRSACEASIGILVIALLLATAAFVRVGSHASQATEIVKELGEKCKDYRKTLTRAETCNRLAEDAKHYKGLEFNCDVRSMNVSLQYQGIRMIVMPGECQAAGEHLK